MLQREHEPMIRHYRVDRETRLPGKWGRSLCIHMSSARGAPERFVANHPASVWQVVIQNES